MLRWSLGKSAGWKDSLRQAVAREGLDWDLCWRQTDGADLSEGCTSRSRTIARCWPATFVRRDFVQTILDSGSHHASRPIVPNGLAPGVDIYAERPCVTWESLGLRTMFGLDALEAAARPRK